MTGSPGSSPMFAACVCEDKHVRIHQIRKAVSEAVDKANLTGECSLLIAFALMEKATDIIKIAQTPSCPTMPKYDLTETGKAHNFTGKPYYNCDDCSWQGGDITEARKHAFQHHGHTLALCQFVAPCPAYPETIKR